MLALLGVLAALAPDPLPPPPTPAPRAVVVRVDARLTGLETRLRTETSPSRLRDVARMLVERARSRLAAGDAAAADQLGAAASDTLNADRLVVIQLRLPPGVPLPGTPLPGLPRRGLPRGFDLPHGPGAPPEAEGPLSAASAARRLDRTAAMLAMTAGFAARGEAAKLLGLARTALDDARKALAANDARKADGAARRAEALARAALHAAIAEDPALRPPRPPPPPAPGEWP